jgi:hypothetical protein
LSDDVDCTAAVVDAREDLTRGLRNSLTADDEHARGGESTRDDASIEHIFLQMGSWMVPVIKRYPSVIGSLLPSRQRHPFV